MAELLFIRLASTDADPIHWLITSSDRSEIIGSGELASASNLSELTEKAQQRKVVAFVPASDVVIKSLNVPAKSQRAMRLAAPYMLEEDLSQEVEELFFAYSSLKSGADHNCLLAAVERKQIELWQSWLDEAGIFTDQFIPDALALPLVEDQATVLQVGQQMLVKQGNWQATAYDDTTWQYFLSAHEQDENTEKLRLNALSPLNVESAEVVENLAELPLLALAQNTNAAGINLLQGEFQVKQKRSTAFTHWRLAASLIFVAFIVNLTGKGLELAQLTEQQEAVEQEIVSTYKKTFPQARRVSVGTVRSQLKRKMAEVGDGDQEEAFLDMVNKLQPAFAKVSDLKPETIKFDGKRKEVRIQAVATNYQAFEAFKAELEKVNLTVSQGSQNNQGDQVVGSFSIKEDS